jgi:hypothetical protein
MTASASEDIAPTCPCEDPTPGIAATAEVAYAALVDQHMVPLERTKDRMPDLLPWDALLPVRHWGRPMDVALPLSYEYLPSVASCSFPASDKTLDASLLAGSLIWPPDVCTCLVEVKSWLGSEFLVLRVSLICFPPPSLWTLRLESSLLSRDSKADLTGVGHPPAEPV